MNPATIHERVLVPGVVLIVVAIGIRARMPLLLLPCRSTLALRAMMEMYVSRLLEGMARAIMLASGDPQARA